MLLCEKCHGKVHEQPLSTSVLAREGMERRRAKGLSWGRPKQRCDKSIYKLRDQGLSTYSIAKELNVSQSAVKRSIQERGKIEGGIARRIEDEGSIQP